MIVLRPVDLHWINRAIDNPADLCAHASVEFQIDDDNLVQSSEGIWTVSAAALYLLRALSQIHTRENPVAEHLFPHCGNGMFQIDGNEDVVIIGCNMGKNFDVERQGNEFVVTAPDGHMHRVVQSEWQDAVCKFSDAVAAFYQSSSPKHPTDVDDEKGFRTFWREWARRRDACRK